jgi:hypothetical protein
VVVVMVLWFLLVPWRFAWSGLARLLMLGVVLIVGITAAAVAVAAVPAMHPQV